MFESEVASEHVCDQIHAVPALLLEVANERNADRSHDIHAI
jgi:hypothetical protein